MLKQMCVPSELIVAHTMTTDAYLTQFEAWLVTGGKNGRGRAALSVEAHSRDIEIFSRWFEDHTGQGFAPELITTTDLRAYFHQSIEVDHLKPATWNRRRISLSLFCSWAHTSGNTAYNPFQGIPAMEEVQQAPKWLDKSDYSKFMRKVEQSANTAHTEHARKLAVRDQAMVALMVYGGLRESEVCELAASDLLLTDRKGRVVVRRGKGSKERQVPLGNEARRAIQSWIDLRGVADETGLFEGITARQVQRRVAALGSIVGVEVTPHQLRHTMLKRFIDSGGKLTEAAQIAGHSRLETTARYTQPGWQDLEAAVENL